MRSLAPGLILFCAAVSAAERPPLSHVHSVYLLPMGSGFDQYLANHLTRSGVFLVVTDPQKADAVFSDRLGEALEKRLDDLYPTPEMIARKAEEEKKRKEQAEKREGGAGGEYVPDTFRPRSTFGGGKGNIYLVDRKSRTVLWSVYERPRNIASEQLDRSAGRVVKKLQESLAGKP